MAKSKNIFINENSQNFQITRHDILRFLDQVKKTTIENIKQMFVEIPEEEIDYIVNDIANSGQIRLKAESVIFVKLPPKVNNQRNENTVRYIIKNPRFRRKI